MAGGLPRNPGAQGPPRAARSGTRRRLVLNYLSYALLASVRVLAWGRRRRWDVAFVFEISPVTQIFPAVLLQRLAGIPFAVWVQDLWPESVTASGLVRSPALVGMIRRMSSWLYTRADLLLGSSRGFLPRLRALGARPERLGYLPNWAEDVFEEGGRPSPGREPWEGGFPIMFAGNLGRVQGLETVLDAATLLRDESDVRWILVGDGSLLGWLQDEIARRKLSGCVFLVGRRPLSDMPGLFAKAGALLVSLTADDVVSLTIPSKLQTYLAAGRPVLGSIDGEAGRVISESGAGLASPAGDAAGLAENAMRLARMSSDDLASLGARGRDVLLPAFRSGRVPRYGGAAIVRPGSTGAMNAGRSRHRCEWLRGQSPREQARRRWMAGPGRLSRAIPGSSRAGSRPGRRG